MINKFVQCVILALALSACSDPSSSSQTIPVTNEDATVQPQADAGSSCDPNAVVPCFKDHAEPCVDINSGYPGDEYCIKPPAPEIGMQVHVGPRDYTDPTETSKYEIQPGNETNWAEIVQFPNTETKFTRGYRSFMRPGSHHFIMFGTDQNTNPNQGPIQNSGGAESAVGAVGGRFLGGATKQIQNIDTASDAPEDTGIGSEIPPNSFVAMNLHWFNSTEEVQLQEIWVNFIFIPENEVTQYVKPITWYGGVAMNVPIGYHVTLDNITSGQSCAAPADVRIGMMTAHAHANTLRVTTTRGTGELLFEDYDWHEPTEWRYNSVLTNQTPDRSVLQSGGASGVQSVYTGETFNWECEIQNESGVNLTFGNRVETAEMCNVFGFYITPDITALPWSCVFIDGMTVL